MYCKESSYEVGLLPLSDKYTKQFDSAKAWEYFKEVKGSLYSVRGDILAVIDTLSDNYPPPLSLEIMPILMRYMDAFYPELFKHLIADPFYQRETLKDGIMPETFEALYSELLILEEDVNITSALT